MNLHYPACLSLCRSFRTCFVSDVSVSFLSRAGASKTLPCNQCVQQRRAHSSRGKMLNAKVTRNNSEELISLKQFLKDKAARRCSYVFDKELAGIGLVSEAFLAQGVEKVIALETEILFHPYLKLLQEEFGEDRFEFHNWKILNLYDKFNYHSFQDSTVSYKRSEASVVNSLSESHFYNKDTPYSIFTLGGSQENRDFIFYVLRNLPTEDPILSKERVEFFFLVHPKFKISMEQILPTHRPTKYTRYFSYLHTFIGLLYDVHFIDELKRIDYHKRHLVRIQLKADIEAILPLEHHYPFIIFLRNVMRKKKTRIVLVMEIMMAGCGVRMIAAGFTMMERVADVSPDRLLILYKNMLTWPEYSVSHLQSYIEMKTKGGPVDGEEGQEEEEFI